MSARDNKCGDRSPLAGEKVSWDSWGNFERRLRPSAVRMSRSDLALSANGTLGTRVGGVIRLPRADDFLVRAVLRIEAAGVGGLEALR